MESKQQQLTRVAHEHGYECRHNLNGGIDIKVYWTKPGTAETGFDWQSCHDLRSLKLAMGY